MKRAFDEHLVRRKISLDGFWRFARDEKNTGSSEHWERNFPAVTESMVVPSCWDTKAGHFDYDGAAWYKKDIHLGGKANALLHFEGVSGIADVFLDGIRLGRHNGSYTSFSFLKKSLAAGKHELVVKVDNFAYPGKVMPDYADWHLYGGIFRSAAMSMLGAAWIKDLYIDYQLSGGKVTLSPRTTIRNLSRQVLDDKVRFYLNDMEIGGIGLRLSPGEEQTVECRLGDLDLPLWSPQSPNLHRVRVEYADDDLCERTGFRKIEMRKNGFVINGQWMKICGVNRHHDYGDSGFAVPPEITLRDFEIIRDMGCNAVRCHYPIDRYAMDICDELGLLFWSEIPFYGRWPFVVAQKKYLALGEQCIREMVSNYYNHPSIFTWSVLNECATDVPQGLEAVRRFTARARSCDSTRPVSYASNKILGDLGYGHLDLIGVNGYPGWYDAAKDKPPKWSETIAALNVKLQKEGLAGLPVLVTETGAGAIYGDRSLEDRKWSENTQVKILEDNLSYLLSCDDVAGVFIWQFCDTRTQTRNWNSRPGCNNNKGLVDRFRRPKMAYYKVKELYSSAAGRPPS